MSDSVGGAPDDKAGRVPRALKLDGYIRVSRVGKRQGESFISPDHQRQQIASWAKLRGVSIANWETDLDKTGRKLSRPGLDRIIRRIETGSTGGIAVAYLDRLSRAGVADALKLVEKVVEDGGTLAAIDLGIDPTTPFGEFALTVMLGLAHMQSRRIGDMFLESRTRAVERGQHISGHEPFGYLRGRAKILYPDPATSWAVAEAFRLRARADSWKTIANWLTEEGLPTRHGAPAWTIATVRTMIRNRVYLGEARSGDLVKIGAHEPLTDERTWLSANRRQGTAPVSSGNAASVLSGIIRCAGCSFALKPSMGRTRHGKLRRELRCRPDKAAGRCPAPASASAEPLEAFVLKQFFDRYGSLPAEAQKRTEERATHEARLEASRSELTAVLDGRLAEALGGEHAELYIATVRQRREAVERDEDAVLEIDDDFDSLPLATDLKADWGNRTLQQRRTFIGLAYDAIFLRRARSPREPVGDRLRFFATGTAPPLPVRGQRTEIRSVDVD